MSTLPIAGTRSLHAELTPRAHEESKRLRPSRHSRQAVFNYRHPHIPDGMEGEYVVRAFQRDFDLNGPSVIRIARTTLGGWQRLQASSRICESATASPGSPRLGTDYAAAVGGTRLYYRAQGKHPHAAKVNRLAGKLYRGSGIQARLAASLGPATYGGRCARNNSGFSEVGPTKPPTFFEVKRIDESTARIIALVIEV